MAEDKNGWLPLYHSAYSSKSVAVLQLIHDSFPEAISKPHYSGTNELKYALTIEINPSST